jgi:hypothetical protein
MPDDVPESVVGFSRCEKNTVRFGNIGLTANQQRAPALDPFGFANATLAAKTPASVAPKENEHRYAKPVTGI